MHQRAMRDATRPDQRMEARIDPRLLAKHLRTLADNDMEGRESETKGIAHARAYLRACFAEFGLEPLFPGYSQPFVFDGLDGRPTQGFNIIGSIRGVTAPACYLTVSAHYDHLGRDGGAGGIFNGADDNASGVAAVLEAARAVAADPPECTIVFCLFDGEEANLKGSRAFIERAPIALENIGLEINVDMIGRADEGLLWAAGAHHSPWLEPHLQAIAAAVDVPLVLGHDRFSLRRGDDWTHESDHGSFHDAGIPWLHFGVSNHGDTHQTTDEISRIDEEFLTKSAECVYFALRHFDSIGDELLELRHGR